MAIAPVFAPVFLGEDFAGCAPIMCVLACVIPVISITNVLGRQYLLPTERDWLYTISLCIGAVVNVIINIILIPYMGAMGAAIGTVAAELSVLMAQSYMVHKELPLLRYFLKSIPFAVCGLLMMIFVRMISELLTPGLLNMFIEIFIGCVVYSVLAGLLILFVIRKNKVFRRVS
jgi:O-antigen/teichoic acid export membrane protein